MPAAVRAAALAASATITLLLSGCGEGGGEDHSGHPTALPMDITTALPAHASPLDSYVDENDDHCRPWLSRSTCPDGSYRGLVIFFHGYSACAQQVNAIGPLLNARCLDVFAPNHPGHGIESITDCDKVGANCTIRWKNGRLGFNLEKVPHHATQYMDHVSWANDMFEREIAFRANATGKAVGDLHRGVAGLSLGGALATYAVLDRPGLYSHQLLVNPFFGASEQSIDESVRMSAVQRQMEMMFEREVLDGLTMASDFLEGNPNAQIFEDKLSLPQSWDENCPKIFAGHRNGFCTFELRHAGATNSLGQHTIARALSTPATAFPLTQIITTERDGLSRNGYTYALARHISQGHSDAAMCMYRFSEDTDRTAPGWDSSDNCIPHASLDPLDNPFIDRWWEDGIFHRITSFLSHNATNVESETWRGTRDECVEMPLGGTAMLTHQWMRQTVDPHVAPRSELELHGIPGLMEDGSGLEPDRWARTACHIPLVGSLVNRVSLPMVGHLVNCSLFDRPGHARTRPNLSAPPGSSATTRLVWDAAAALGAWVTGTTEDSAEDRKPADALAAAQEGLKGGRGAVEEWLAKSHAERMAPAVMGLAPLVAAVRGRAEHAPVEPADERVEVAEERAAAAEKRAAAAEKRAAAAERREKRAEAAEKRAEALEKRAEAREKRAEERERLAEGGAVVEDRVAPTESSADLPELEPVELEPEELEPEETESEDLDDQDGVGAQPSLGELVGRLAAHKGQNTMLKELSEKLLRRRGAEGEAEEYSPNVVVESILLMLKRIAGKLAHGRESKDVVEERLADDPATSSERVSRDARAVEDLMSGRKTPLADLRTLHKDLDGHTLGQIAGTLAARNANHAVIENIAEKFTHPTDDVIIA